MSSPAQLLRLPRVPSYPAVLDEFSVRLTAGVILLFTLSALATHQWWLYALLAVDFLLRATLGPRFSPFAQTVRRVLRPRIPLPSVPTAAAPKRFAAGIGAVLTATAAVLLAGPAASGAAGVGAVDIGAAGLTVWAIAVAMVVFPALEAFAGLCVGCQLFRLLVRAGLLRDTVCVDCVPRAQNRTSREVDHV